MKRKEQMNKFLSEAFSICLLTAFCPVVFSGETEPIDLELWQRKREVIQRDWIQFLGPLATVRELGTNYPSPDIEILEETQEEKESDGFLRRKIRYESEKGKRTLAYLLIPKNITKPVPGVVVFHSTTNESYRQGAGVENVTEKSFGYHLAKRGYVTICPQNYLWDDENPKADIRRLTREFLDRNPTSKGMARMILDGQVAVDILASLPEVDAKRIGCVGHSLGAKETLYLPAFDDRIVCSISSEGGIGIEQSNWEADWYLGSEVKKSDFPLNHREIVSLIAPRPFLLLGGDASDGEKSRPYVEAAKKIFRLYGAENNIELFNHKKGHAVPPEAENRMYDWFEKYLPIN